VNEAMRGLPMRRWHGFRLLAVDGSMFLLPKVPATTTSLSPVPRASAPRAAGSSFRRARSMRSAKRVPWPGRLQRRAVGARTSRRYGFRFPCAGPL